MHTKPPKPLWQAGRDRNLPRVYKLASLRFQVGVINRRLGDHGRYLPTALHNRCADDMLDKCFVSLYVRKR